jgi:hypothetical protein
LLETPATSKDEVETADPESISHRSGASTAPKQSIAKNIAYVPEYWDLPPVPEAPLPPLVPFLLFALVDRPETASEPFFELITYSKKNQNEKI